jgi:hypothetical protein
MLKGVAGGLLFIVYNFCADGVNAKITEPVLGASLLIGIMRVVRITIPAGAG